jgi:tetratricopeptide (TPR) repeat protein
MALVAIVGFRPDAEHLAQVTPFLTPLVVAVALLAGAGVDALRRVRVPASARSAVRLAAPAAAAVLAAHAGIAHFGACDRSGFTLPARYGRELLAGLPPGATLVLDGDNETFLAAYAQREGGVRSDVTLIHRRGYIFGDPYGLRAAPRSRWVGIAHRVDLERLERAATPVYYSTPPEDLAGAGVRFLREGLVYRAVAPGRDAGRDAGQASRRTAEWPRSTALLGGAPARFDYVERKLAVTWSDVMARSLWEQGRLEEALPWFEDAVRVGFDFPEARVNLAVTAEALGREEQAAVELLTAHALDPRRPEAAARLAALLARAGQYREAARWFERAYGARPDPALASLAARAWERAGDASKARLWSRRTGSPRAEAPRPAPGGTPDETLGSRA